MQEGDLIAGRYRLQERAGAGAMGIVFRAQDAEHADHPVALKAWRSDGSASAERFRREATALASLQEPALVRYIHHGVSERGELYLVMEWIEGPTLAERLAGPGVTPLETLQLGMRLVRGLAALHACGIVHRDIKPSNLMLPNNDVRAIQILDLGVARLAHESVELTIAGSQLGTPRYMAPEQIRDPSRVDGRADVFALGSVLFECLTGVPAFPGDDGISVLAQILFAHPVAASELRPELPEELDQLLARLLARRPELRPSASEELLAELARLLAPPFLQQLEALPAMPQLPPRAVSLLTQAAAETIPEVSGERLSTPHLLDRVSRVPQSILAEPQHHAFVGREREVALLLSWLQQGDPITLWGGAGIGKTRLALELVQQAVSRKIVAEHEALFCDLGSARDSADVVRICADQIGISCAGQEDPEDFLGRMLAKFGSLLLVLDRGEHLARELPPLMQLWSSQAPGLRLLVTSRVRLRSARDYALGPLEHREHTLPGRTPLSAAPSLQPTAAGSLVLALARASQPEPSTLEMSTDTLAQAEAIASALDGNPLAIELALARLPLLGFQGILERLTTQLSLLGEQQSGSTTMRRAIAWSWQLLDSAERSAFMQCAVFRGPFSLRAAESVIVLPAGSGAVLDVVQSLREQSLLSARAEAGQAGAVRLSMPAVLREFAQEHLLQAGSSHAALSKLEHRHAEYCLALARADAGKDESAPRHLEAEDAIAAIELSLSEDGFALARGFELLCSLEHTLSAAGPGSRLAELLERALIASDRLCDVPDAQARFVARARQLRARLLAPVGELARAQAELLLVLAEAERLHDDALQGTALLDLGVVEHFRRDLVAARSHYQRALELLSDADADDAVAEARCHGNLGAVSHDEGQLMAAGTGYRRALALLPEKTEERLRANFQGNLALVEHELGRTAEARKLYAEATGRLESLLDARLLGIVLGNFGTLELAEGDHAAALGRLSRAHALLEQSGDRRSEGLSLARLGAALAVSGRVPDAEQRLARAERLLRKDALGRAVVSLLSAFVDLAAAEEARKSGANALAGMQLQAAVDKCAAARVERVGERSLYEQSDDLRLYLGILGSRLNALRVRVSG